MKLDKITKRLMKLLPDDGSKILMIETMLGLSAIQTKFISENFPVYKIPTSIQYAILLTSKNMMAILSDDKSEVALGGNLGTMDLSDKEKIIFLLKEFMKIYADELK